jgi:glyoxylase-like metal-dependent hydrolase (beta-lactamase superfamily II)/predicted DCC family thiol-disulfide oxidoreductase YuxK
MGPSSIDVERRQVRAASGTFTVLYDAQCEVCQAGVSWLTLLDRDKRASCIPIDSDSVRLDPRLRLEDCLRELHVLGPASELLVGWDAVCELARQCGATRMLGIAGTMFPLRGLGRFAYRFVARNRWALSKCRGGACSTARPDAVRRQARLGAFWSCYALGFLVRLPLIAGAAIADAVARVGTFRRTYRRHLSLLGGKLQILFLDGLLPNTVPLIFGELFTTIVYDGIVVDPGSPKMRRSLAGHLATARPRIDAIVATHAHEEHVGNLNWLAERAQAPVFVSEATADLLRPFKKLPWVRRTIIGQPPSLEPPFRLLGETLSTASGELRVLATPGHCDDHVVLYDPAEKLLLAGDAFMGSYFATPNPDVDSRKWVATLERLLELDVEILVEGHGHIHTLRADVPDIAGVVIRHDPREAIAEKLTYMRWLRRQIETGLREGLPLRAIEATCFPWSRRSSWESCANDECIRLLSLGHFSRTELVRSFVRQGPDVLPTVYEVRLHASRYD